MVDEAIIVGAVLCLLAELMPKLCRMVTIATESQLTILFHHDADVWKMQEVGPPNPRMGCFSRVPLFAIQHCD
jgi:hypothetical protein